MKKLQFCISWFLIPFDDFFTVDPGMSSSDLQYFLDNLKFPRFFCRKQTCWKKARKFRTTLKIVQVSIFIRYKSNKKYSWIKFVAKRTINVTKGTKNDSDQNSLQIEQKMAQREQKMFGNTNCSKLNRKSQKEIKSWR